MATLVGDTSTAAFSSTVGINSGVNNNIIFFTGNQTNNYVASGTGPARNLELYISSWGGVSNIKACLYDESNSSALMEVVLINSSVGTGLVTIPLAGTETITSGNNYRLGIYTEQDADITLFSDPTMAHPYIYSANPSGNYTNPMNPGVNGGWLAPGNIYYWAINDDVAGPTVALDQTDCAPGDTITWTEDLTGTATGAKLIDSQGNEFDLINVTDNGNGTGSGQIPSMSAGLSACLFESGVTFELTDGTDSPTDTINYNPPAGYSLVTLASLGGAGDATDWTHNFDSKPIGTQSIWNDSNITHNTDETTTTTGATTYTYYAVDPTDGGVSQINKTFAADGSVASTNTGFGIGIATNMGIGL